MNNCTITRAVDERTFVCIEEAPSLWPPGTVCQCGTWAWAQSNASSWHCAYDTSNTLNYVQLTVMHVLVCFGFCMIPCVKVVYIAVFLSLNCVLPLLWYDASRWDASRLIYTRNWLVFLLIYVLLHISVSIDFSETHSFDSQYKVKWECYLVSIRLDSYSKGSQSIVEECIPLFSNAVCFGSALGHR